VIGEPNSVLSGFDNERVQQRDHLCPAGGDFNLSVQYPGLRFAWANATIQSLSGMSM
jgi:hypothetical protein